MEPHAKLKILFQGIEKILFSNSNYVYVFYAHKDYFRLIPLVFVLRPAVKKGYKEQQCSESKSAGCDL